MMKTKVRPAAVPAALCVIAMAVALAACGDDATDANAPQGGAVTKAAPRDTSAEATVGMVSGVPADGKPGAPVDLKFELKTRPVLNEALPIEIALIPREESELLRASFLAPDSLVIAASPVPVEYRNVEAKSVYRHTLTVTPSEEGVFYVSAFVAMNMVNGTQVRTFHIPVLVGAPRDASEAVQSGTPKVPAKPAGNDGN